MDRKSLKRIDFAEFEKVGKHNFDQRYYARIKNEHNKVLVKKNSWGNYTILVDDVVHFEEPTKMETLLIETEDNGFVISNAIGRVYPLGKDLEMVTFTGHTTPFSDEVFIGRKKSNGNECLIRCNGLQNLDIREYRKIKYSKDRRCFVVWENSVITPCHVLNDCLCKVSENIQDISAPNSEGFSCKKIADLKYAIGLIDNKKSDTYFEDIFMKDANRKLFTPTKTTPVKLLNGKLALVDGTVFRAPIVSNMIDADSLSAPDENGVVTITKRGKKGNTYNSTDIALFAGDKYQYEISLENQVSNKKFFGDVVKLLKKTKGEGLKNLSSEYFSSPKLKVGHDLSLAFKKFAEDELSRFMEIVLSGRDQSELDKSQAEYLEFLMDAKRSEFAEIWREASEEKARVRLNRKPRFENKTIDELLAECSGDVLE